MALHVIEPTQYLCHGVLEPLYVHPVFLRRCTIYYRYCILSDLHSRAYVRACVRARRSASQSREPPTYSPLPSASHFSRRQSRSGLDVSYLVPHCLTSKIRNPTSTPKLQRLSGQKAYRNPVSPRALPWIMNFQARRRIAARELSLRAAVPCTTGAYRDGQTM
jgi:hypothetical protein